MARGETVPRKVIIQRVLRGRIEDVWDLWTTKAGLESWWGPEGFATTVRKLDLRPGGEIEYEMTVTDPELRKWMDTAGLLHCTVVRGMYTEVTLRQRLAYTTFVDFVPNSKPYETSTVVEFQVTGDEVRIALVTDVMHNEEWTERAGMGYNSQFDRLEKLLTSASRRKLGP